MTTEAKLKELGRIIAESKPGSAKYNKAMKELDGILGIPAECSPDEAEQYPGDEETPD